MPRPRKFRRVGRPPAFICFKPRAVPFRNLKKVVLSLDEFEAIRLADHEGLEHAAAAERMNISRPTFTRLIEAARRKTAQAIVEGAALLIEGGSVDVEGDFCRCPRCGGVREHRRGGHHERCGYCGTEHDCNDTQPITEEKQS
ncbi:MAG TPA: DUF134 domain-containing protein [bacterium]|nr:DUF134 domain-containing protein [bacterium]